jgi:hypothetical protein
MAQLAACGGDVAATAGPDVRVDVPGDENPLELEHVLGARPLELEPETSL